MLQLLLLLFDIPLPFLVVFELIPIDDDKDVVVLHEFLINFWKKKCFWRVKNRKDRLLRTDFSYRWRIRDDMMIKGLIRWWSIHWFYPHLRIVWWFFIWMFILFTCWHCWMIIIIFFEYINLQDFLIVYENPR